MVSLIHPHLDLAQLLAFALADLALYLFIKAGSADR